MIWGFEDGKRLWVSPSGIRERSYSEMALRSNRSSPATYNDTKPWIRVSPTYCICS